MNTRKNLRLLYILILLGLPAPGMAGNPYEIVRVEGPAPITVDGILLDWETLEKDLVRIEKIGFINPDPQVLRDAKPPNDEKDLSANFRTFADRDYLYFGVTVSDEELVFGESQYGFTNGDDAVEIVFNSPRPIKIIFSADENGLIRMEGLAYDREKRYPYLPELAGVRAKLKPGTGGYTVEIAVPLILLSRLGGWKAGDSLPMGVNVYDDDDGGDFESYITWVNHPPDYATVVLSGANELKIDFPEEKITEWERDYIALERIVNEDWRGAEESLASLGGDPRLEPLLGEIRILAGKNDKGIEILSRLALEGTDDWTAMWAADKLIEYYGKKRDYKSETDIFQVLLNRKKKYNYRSGARKSYFWSVISLADLHVYHTKDFNAANRLCDEILAMSEGLGEREIGSARRIKGDLQWNEYIERAAVKEISAVENVKPALIPKVKLFQKDHTIYFAESAEKPAEKIFTNEKFHADKLKVSPSGKLIAANGVYRDTTIATKDSQKNNSYTMFILDTKGKIINKIENVFKFDWSPRQDRICYIEGFYNTDHDYNYGQTLYLLDPLTDQKEDISNAFLKKILEDLTWTGIKGKIDYYDISWALFDCSIYARFGVSLEHNWGLGIFKYNPVTGEVNPTPYKALDFSPDGKYYFDSSQEGEPAALYLRDKNEEIVIEPTGEGNIFYLQEWLISKGKTFAFLMDGHIKRWKLDCETGKLKLLPAPAAAVKKIDLTGPYSAAFCEIHCLYFRSEGDGKLKKIFSDDKLLILSLKISPRSNFIALQGNKIRLDSAGEDQPVFQPRTLILIDSCGKLLKRIEGVRSYAWNPQGDRLVFIEEIQKTRGFFNGEAIHVLDPLTGAQKTITPPDSAINYTNVNWAAFDGNIYYNAVKTSYNTVKTRKKFSREDFKIKYDPKNGQETRLSEPEKLSLSDKIRMDLNFSPDGKYFFHEASYPKGAALGLLENWQFIRIKEPESEDFQNLYFLAWESLGGKTYTYVYNIAGPNLLLWKLDCESGTLSPVASPKGTIRPLGVIDGKIIWLKSGPDGSYISFRN